jgi:hypothetical protein
MNRIHISKARMIWLRAHVLEHAEYKEMIALECDLRDHPFRVAMHYVLRNNDPDMLEEILNG